MSYKSGHLVPVILKSLVIFQFLHNKVYLVVISCQKFASPENTSLESLQDKVGLGLHDLYLAPKLCLGSSLIYKTVMHHIF